MKQVADLLPAACHGLGGCHRTRSAQMVQEIGGHGVGQIREDGGRVSGTGEQRHADQDAKPIPIVGNPVRHFFYGLGIHDVALVLMNLKGCLTASHGMAKSSDDTMHVSFFDA